MGFRQTFAQTSAGGALFARNFPLRAKTFDPIFCDRVGYRCANTRLEQKNGCRLSYWAGNDNYRANHGLSQNFSFPESAKIPCIAPAEDHIYENPLPCDASHTHCRDKHSSIGSNPVHAGSPTPCGLDFPRLFAHCI